MPVGRWSRRRRCMPPAARMHNRIARYAAGAAGVGRTRTKSLPTAATGQGVAAARADRRGGWHHHAELARHRRHDAARRPGLPRNPRRPDRCPRLPAPACSTCSMILQVDHNMPVSGDARGSLRESRVPARAAWGWRVGDDRERKAFGFGFVRGRAAHVSGGFDRRGRDSAGGGASVPDAARTPGKSTLVQGAMPQMTPRTRSSFNFACPASPVHSQTHFSTVAASRWS